MKFVREYHLDASYSGNDAKLSYLSVAQITQNGVTNALDVFGLGNIAMRKNNLMWVFTKSIYLIDHQIGWDDYYRLEAYPTFMNKVIVWVNVIAFDIENKVIFEARIEMCAVNFLTRRIVRISEVPGIEKLQIYSRDFIPCNNKEEEGYVFVKDKEVGFSSIDFSHHCNNTEYIRFIFDLFPDVAYEELGFKGYEIHFIKESKLGDILSIYKKSNDYLIKRGEEIIAKVFFISD